MIGLLEGSGSNRDTSDDLDRRTGIGMDFDGRDDVAPSTQSQWWPAPKVVT
ncbi:7987_t:CDS:1, partial [Acaulospora colombiana]